MDDQNILASTEQLEEPAELFPIRTIASLTDINSVTLRAWERRYQLITPQRTATGHRLYNQNDIDKINKAVALLEKGMSISQAANVLNNPAHILPFSQDNTPSWQEYRQRILDAVTAFDEVRLEDIYQEALALHPVQTVTRMLIIPSLKELGIRWKTAEGGVAEEHFFSAFLRNKLGARFHHRSRNNTGPILLSSCLPKETHEIGLLLFCLAADEHNYRLILLGANMPLYELPNALDRSDASAIILSGKTAPDPRTLEVELPYLTSRVSAPVFIGGDVSLTHKEAITEAGAIALNADIDKGLQTLDHYLKK